MRYVIPLFILVLLLAACNTESGHPTLPPTEPPTELSVAPDTQESTTAPTEVSIEAPTEQMTGAPTHAPDPTLPGDTEYLKQCVLEYLESRFAYLSGEEIQVSHVSETLMRTIEAKHQDLQEEGIVLIDIEFAFGEIYHEGTYADLYVWRTVTYSVGGQETTKEIECKLFVAPDDQGNLVVAGDSPSSDYEIGE